MLSTLMHILFGCVMGLLFIFLVGALFELISNLRIERCTCGPDGKCSICASGKKWRIIIRL